jgi:LmbE family N-acetylglucosaminyl deacetylase
MRRLLLVFLFVVVAGVRIEAGNHNAYPLPEDRGTAGILHALKKLPVYARVLHTTAHPDDEAAGALVWLSREAHARTALFSLTRGEGGQNVLGDEKYEAMGLVRTGELLEACRHYGTELYFSTAFEFGFSKSAEETIAKWGHEETLGELVHFIRKWRPAVIISRFEGTPRDGHAHHQASGALTREAFRAAADPRRFPEQLQGGVGPWQAYKLYVGARMGQPGAAGAKPEPWTVRVPIGDWDPVLGRSYREIGSEGYSHHRSQGAGANFALPGPGYDYYLLADAAGLKKEREESFFEGIDISLRAIADLAGGERAKLPESFLSDLTLLQQQGEAALAAFGPEKPAASAPHVAQGMETLKRLQRSLAAATLSGEQKSLLEAALRQKHEDYENALNAVLGIYLIARGQDATVAPGQIDALTIQFFNRGSEPVEITRLGFSGTLATAAKMPAAAPSGEKVQPRENKSFKATLETPEQAAPTQPFWYRNSPAENRYSTRPTAGVFFPFMPFGSPELTADATYVFAGAEARARAPIVAQAGDALRGVDFVELQIVPSLAVTIDPPLAVAPLSPRPQTREFRVSVLNNDKAGARGAIRLAAPRGWSVHPAEISFTLSREGESFTGRFEATIPGGAPPGKFPVEAVARTAKAEYRQGYRSVSYPENWTRNNYSPARSEVAVFDVRIAPKLKVGYVMGAGDDVPAALRQLGVDVQLLSSDDLAHGDLSRFSAIVTGIRAYNVNEALRANNARLLQYVERGGTLLVQYNQPLRAAPGQQPSPFPYAPYPMSVSAAERITVEESPVRMPAPQHPALSRPNRIDESDFKGWVQERGLYFAAEWDARYTPLLEGSDPGEAPKRGGMLVAQYGKGHYVFTAYAWFRQLPAGVPGAFRIVANLLSLGN